MSKLQAGIIIELEVIREAPFGYFLTDGEQDVLLHETEMERGLAEGETVEVFIYQDKKGRLAATMTLPEVVIGSYDWATVVEVKNHLGVFVDIGIKKDMLVSMDDLPDEFENWPQIGDEMYCTLKVDKKAGLLGRPATEDQIEEIWQPASESWFNQEVSGTVYRLVMTGSFVITREGLKGFIHESEQKGKSRLGQKVSGRVIGVKEDGTINVSLLPRNHERMGDDAQKIYTYLQGRKGPMPYGDHTHPDDIQAKFNMSKGAFKRALGRLMKEKKVYQKDGWTHLNSERE
ncbi:MAG TPA: S1-like domain-containing RNA-binding protein [Bacillales bacterium]|nr:S1-like domain-containing RNA-binding protein [Bacillales bacterium]